MARISDIDLRLLRIFVAVAEARGFAAAEAYLNISTSTISVHMSNLEKRLGIHLCERGRGGFRLTERGQIVFQEARAILKSLDDFSGRLSSIKSVLGGQLSIGMVDGLVSHSAFPISDAVRRFNEVENEVQIELVVAPRQKLEHDVIEGQLHAAIGPFVRNISGLDFVPLYTENHELYCGKGHPLFGVSKKMAGRLDISSFPSIVRLYQYDFDYEKLGVIREQAVVNSMEALLTLLLSGGYIGFLPDHYARSWVERGDLSAIPDPDLSYTSTHTIVTKRGVRESLALAKFVSLAKDVCVTRLAEPV
ncbi:MAG: LysR family transcriptional regulator [Pseudomonadota bacterium]